MRPGISMLGSLSNGITFPLLRNSTPKATNESIAANEKTVLPILDNDGGEGRIEDCFELMKKSFFSLFAFCSLVSSLTTFAFDVSCVVKYGWSQNGCS